MLHKWLAPKLILPLHDRLSGQYTWRKTRQMLAAQWLPLPELKKRALDRLRTLLEHAYYQVPYYRDLFDNAGFRPDELNSLADLARIPLTGPDKVRRHFDNTMLAKNLPAARRLKDFTSGSSGLPLNFYNDRQTRTINRASYLFFRQLAGIDPWDAALWLTGSPHYRGFAKDNPPLVMAARRHLLGEILHHADGSRFSLEALRDFAASLPKRRDYFIQSFPSYLGGLIRQVSEKGGLDFAKPKAVICYAETLGPELSQRASQYLGCPLFNMYSSKEVYCLALSCPQGSGLMHINTERAWLRVVDRKGRDCPPGQPGRVVVTDLHNMVMPLINYDLGDIAVLGPACSCGRGFPTLQSVEGRTSECLYTSQGEAVSASSFARLLFFGGKYLPYIWEYQVCQEDLRRITLRLVPTPQFSGRIAQNIQADLKGYFGHEVDIEIELLERLPWPESGKRPLLISHLNRAAAFPGA